MGHRQGSAEYLTGPAIGVSGSDEMQDIHPAEYEVIRTPGRRMGSVVLAGDFDQTIYGWRRSAPDQALPASARTSSAPTST